MWQITRADLRTQLVEYVKKKKIIDDGDEGTVWHRLSHLNTRYEPSNEQCINHRHSTYCCINYVLVFAVFTIILLLQTVRWSVYFMIDRAKKLKQAKLGQFSMY